LLNLCTVSKMPPFQNLFHLWVQEKSQGARSGEKRGVGHHHHFVFSQKLVDVSLRAAYSVLKKITKHTCRHLEKMSEKLTQSMQRNAPWQNPELCLVCAEDSDTGNIWVPPRMSQISLKNGF